MNADNLKLFFNGVNGMDGSYGLKPMTSEELVERIKGTPQQQPPGQRQLERKLQRDNTDTILRIVRLLAESNAQDVARDAAWHKTWVETLAGVLADSLLPDIDADPDRRSEFEARLARHTTAKTVRIVELLASGQAWRPGGRSPAVELSALLLQDEHEAPDNRDTLKTQLSEDVINQLRRAEVSLRAAGQDSDLAQDRAAQRDWLGGFFRDLIVVDLDALNVAERKRAQLLNPLIQELDRVATTLHVPSTGLDALRQELDSRSPDISWQGLLQVLSSKLADTMGPAGSDVPWPELLTMLDAWIVRVRRLFAPTRRAAVEWVDPRNRGQAGWGILFPHEDPFADPKVAAIKEALQPLLDLRQEQAGDLYKIYEGRDGYRANETAQDFVERHGARLPDPADPEKIPYYLLIVGSPDEIPFHFQYQLDVQYAVGRIDFGSDIQAYANYANSVVAAEAKDASRKVTFFGVSNAGDEATQLSAEHLVEPLYERIQNRHGDQWQINAILRQEAKRARLLRLLGGPETPALLFAACHGIEFPTDAPEEYQARYQGALLCQDWRGPGVSRDMVPRSDYLAGEDLTGDENLLGTIAFFFACFSAGTPRLDEYTKQAFLDEPRVIAEKPFVAPLPKAMLSLSKGALAVVGHVERVWGLSYLVGDRRSRQIAVFESAVERLLKGHPVGSAMEYFNGRYSALSTALTDAMQRPSFVGPAPSDYELAEMWTANNDARGYIVIGDPAVRLIRAEKEGG
jgi:hypothetical protein